LISDKRKSKRRWSKNQRRKASGLVPKSISELRKDIKEETPAKAVE
jgi:hypothetical protein